MKQLILFCLGMLFLSSVSAQVECANVERTVVARIVDTFPARGTFNVVARWPAGSTLRIRFLDGPDTLRRQVMKHAVEWTKFANIKFLFTQSDAAEVRITFDSAGSWSLIGRNALKVPKDQPTMCFGFFDEYLNEKRHDTFYKSIVLHEFGHALGLEHEHLSPYRTFQWKNRDSVYAYYAGPPTYWSRDKVDRNVFATLDESTTNGEYDPQSIMEYRMPGRLLQNNLEIKTNYALSEGDKKVIATLYPRAADTLPAKPQCSGIFGGIHMVTENNSLVIYPVFEVTNAKNSVLKMVVFYYDGEGKPIVNPDQNVVRLKTTNQVVSQKVTLPILSTSMAFNNIVLGTGLAVQLSDLLLPAGFSPVKYLIKVYADNKEIAKSRMFEAKVFVK